MCNLTGKNVEKDPSLATLEVSQSEVTSSQVSQSDVTSSQDGGSLPSSSVDMNMTTPDKSEENVSETSQQEKPDERLELNENDQNSSQTGDEPRGENDKCDKNDDADGGEMVTFKNGEIVSKEYINEGIFCH